jgi:plasmid stabilization system protein ParE
MDLEKSFTKVTGFRIIYRIIDDDNVEILAVVHGAREIKPIFQEEWKL